jgi:hypothetical protein
MNVELIYFNGCPNVEATRKNIEIALKNAGAETTWQEWEQSDPAAPDYTKQYGSPTVLVDGKDVAGGPGDCCARGNCRLYPDGTGIPKPEMIQQALEK